MVKWFIIAVLFLPVAEIAVFVLVAATIGVSWALALMLATTLVGASRYATPAAANWPGCG